MNMKAIKNSFLKLLNKVSQGNWNRVNLDL